MQLAFLIDPLEKLKPHQDSSLWMMREAHARGHSVWVIEPQELFWRGEALARAQPWTPHAAEKAHAFPLISLKAFDAALLRYDPPFDLNYLATTWLLEAAERQGARIFNAPRAVRDHSEKLAILEFPEFIPPTCVVRTVADCLAAISELGPEVVLKPLERMGGSGIVRLRSDDPNRFSLAELLTDHGKRWLVVQRALDLKEGDKRVLLIAGRVFPWALARFPKAGEVRANLAAGGRGVAMPLSPREQEIATALAAHLWQRGLLLVGLDLIAGYLTEINVTSPTCLVELAQQTGENPACWVMDALEAL